MMNRVKCILRFVTIWHPELYLECKAADLRSKPHYRRPRALSNQRRRDQQERDGFKIRLQPMDDGRGTVRLGHGSQVKRYRDTSIMGKQLRPFVEGLSRPEPVLIFVPDEVQEKSKWKCELRTIADWRIQLQDLFPDGFENIPDSIRLEAIDSTRFRETLRVATLRICGLWVNPTHNLDMPKSRAINLVLGPIQGHKLPSADLKILADQGRCWIEYTEQINE